MIPERGRTLRFSRVKGGSRTHLCPFEQVGRRCLDVLTGMLVDVMIGAQTVGTCLFQPRSWTSDERKSLPHSEPNTRHDRSHAITASLYNNHQRFEITILGCFSDICIPNLRSPPDLEERSRLSKTRFSSLNRSEADAMVCRAGEKVRIKYSRLIKGA